MTVDPSWFFFVFAVLILVPVLYLLFTKNIVRAAFAFGLSLLGLAGLFVTLDAAFMAIVQVLIYAGGVLVLLLFGVMLSKSNRTKGIFTGQHYVVVGLVMGSGLLLILGSVYIRGFQLAEPATSSTDLTFRIGVQLLTEHLVAFELIAYLLLVVLVGATFIAKKAGE